MIRSRINVRGRSSRPLCVLPPPLRNGTLGSRRTKLRRASPRTGPTILRGGAFFLAPVVRSNRAADAMRSPLAAVALVLLAASLCFAREDYSHILSKRYGLGDPNAQCWTKPFPSSTLPGLANAHGAQIPPRNPPRALPASTSTSPTADGPRSSSSTPCTLPREALSPPLILQVQHRIHHDRSALGCHEVRLFSAF